MSGTFSVDRATLRTAAQDIRASRVQVDDRLQRLLGVVADIDRAWEGEASDGYRALMGRWDDDARKLLTAMNSIADLLDQSANAHEVNEDQTADAFGRHRVGE